MQEERQIPNPQLPPNERPQKTRRARLGRCRRAAASRASSDRSRLITRCMNGKEKTTGQLDRWFCVSHVHPSTATVKSPRLVIASSASRGAAGAKEWLSHPQRGPQGLPLRALRGSKASHGTTVQGFRRRAKRGIVNGVHAKSHYFDSVRFRASPARRSRNPAQCAGRANARRNDMS